MICIDFSGDYIDVVVTSGTKKRLNIESGVSLKAPPEILTASGDVDFLVLKNCLSPILEQFEEKKVVMTFSFLPTIYSVLRLHKERSRAQQRMAVESQVYANISPETYYVDYYVGKDREKDQEENDGKQTFVSYAMPKNIVTGCFELIKSLDKVPVALFPSQHVAQQFIESYFEDQTIALAKLASSSISLHLLNPPDNIITRDIVVDSSVDSLDIVASMNDTADPQNIFVQNIEKLNSYQNIKFPGKSIDKVIVHGQSADMQLLSFVKGAVSLPCELLSNVDDIFEKYSTVYTIGAMLCSAQQELNFFERITSAKVAAKTSTKKTSKALVAACVLVILNVIVAGVLVGFEFQSQNLIEQREEELNSPETLALIEEYGTLRADYVSKFKSYHSISSLETDIANVGEFNRDTLNEIVDEAPSDVTITSVSFSNRTYNLVCTGQTEQQAADYVEILTNMDIFSEVGYFGFSESGDEVSFTVVCEIN